MRFFVPAFVVLAAVASAQSTACNTNCITVPNGGIQVRAGSTYNLQWSNPSNGQVIIKLQTSVTDITPTSGITLATNVDARTGSYVVTIPANLPASNQYTFEIIDSANPNIYNFSPTFSIAGATGALTTGSSTATTVTSVTRSSGSSSASGSSSSGTAQSNSSTNSMSQTSSSTASRASSSASSSATTAAPNSNTNGASSLKIEGAALALIAAVAGLL